MSSFLSTATFVLRAQECLNLGAAATPRLRTPTRGGGHSIPASGYNAKVNVEHRPEEGRFVLPIGDDEAELLYAEVSPGVLEYGHTFVPPNLRGSGAGGKVVRAALEYAQSEGLRVRPLCSFVAAFIARHPEFKGLVDR